MSVRVCSMEVVLVWRQLGEVSKATARIRYASTCVRAGRRLLGLWLAAARACSRRRQLEQQATLVLSVVKLNLACGTWLSWSLRQGRCKQLRARVNQRLGVHVFKWWLFIAQISAGQTELRARSLQRLAAECFDGWWQLSQQRASLLAQCWQRYLAVFIEGHTLLVRPALFTWRRYSCTQRLVRRLRRAASRRLAIRSAREWRATAVDLAALARQIDAAGLRRSARRTWRMWLGWLAVLRFQKAVVHLCAAALRRRRKRSLRLWRAYSRRKLSLREGARVLAALALYAGEREGEREEGKVGKTGDGEKLHVPPSPRTLAPTSRALSLGAAAPTGGGTGTPRQGLRFECFRACCWLVSGGPGGLCWALDLEGEMAWMWQRRGRRARGVGGLGTFARFQSIISWILQCPALAVVQEGGAGGADGGSEEEGGGGVMFGVPLDEITRRLTLAASWAADEAQVCGGGGGGGPCAGSRLCDGGSIRLEGQELEHASRSPRGSGCGGGRSRSSGGGGGERFHERSVESRASGGSVGSPRGANGRFPLIGPLARWDVRGGWGLSVWGQRYGLVVKGVVLGRWRACVRVVVVGRALANHAQYLGRRCVRAAALGRWRGWVAGASLN